MQRRLPLCHPSSLGVFQLFTKDFSVTAPNPLSANRSHPLVTPCVMAYFPQPTYAMDRVHDLPINARRHLAERYSPRNYLTAPPYVVHISGGTIIGAAPSRFANTTNFPLDETRYTQLATLFQFPPPAVEVAREMGSMLSRLHHQASVDARDVEFVLGGDGGAGFAFFLIDFNRRM